MNRVDFSPTKGMDDVEVERWAKNTWQNNRMARNEFSSEAVFIAYAKANAKGQIKIFGRRA